MTPPKVQVKQENIVKGDTMTPAVQVKQEKTVTVNGNDRSGDLMEHDVVCEKGRGDHERWAGNQLYRFLINTNKEIYNDLTPMERSSIIGNIINGIKEKDGWFVQHEEACGKWVRLSEEKVRKKVSDDLRREVRRRREKRTSNTVFSSKLKALTDKEKKGEKSEDILQQPVEDPWATDVLFGPGARRHPGNKTYWDLMKQNLNHYIISPYGARSMISRSIVQGVRDVKGRFLEQDPKTSFWYEISDKRAIEKTSHALSNKKYKTRKSGPDDQSTQLTMNGLSGAENGYDADSTFSTSNNSSDNETNESRAKSGSKCGSKKSRLLQRMDDPPLDEGVLLLTSLNAVRTKPSPPRPSTPPATPVTQQKGMSMTIITPNDASRAASISSVSDDSGHGGRDSTHRAQKQVPHIVDAPHIHEFIHPKAGRGIGPRVTPRYSRYIGEEAYAHEQMLYQPPPSPYRHHMEDYPPSYRRYAGRYMEPPSPHGAADYHLSPNGHPMPYSAMSPRHAIKHSGYHWVEEHAPAPATRRVEEYSSWH
jgi:hypothetical protein